MKCCNKTIHIGSPYPRLVNCLISGIPAPTYQAWGTSEVLSQVGTQAERRQPLRVFGELIVSGGRVVELGRIWGVVKVGAITAVEEEQDRRQEVEEDTCRAITILSAVEEE
jgi:hypothetical protein